MPTGNLSSWPGPQLEGHLDLGSVGLDLAVLDLEIEFDHFGNAKVTKRPRRLLYGCACSLLPGFLTSADEFNDLVNAFSHACLPSRVGCPRLGLAERLRTIASWQRGL